jgi:hypothetical protein
MPVVLALAALAQPNPTLAQPNPTLAQPNPTFAGKSLVAAFYYPWFGSPKTGGYNHWGQDGTDPPMDIPSAYYPASGLYASSNPGVIATQMQEARRAGINELVVSWWGRGSPEDEVLRDVVAGARPFGINVAVHIEPYTGRTPDTVFADALYLHSLGIDTIYVYQAFQNGVPSDWASMNQNLHAIGMTTFAQTSLVGRAAAGGFSGVYTYDILTWGAGFFGRYCAEAHKVGLLCAPSVGPGFDARKAENNPNVKPRRGGKTYDDMWIAAIASGADAITVTSFNEWQEGTQIEPAIGVTLGAYTYDSYNGAYGYEGTVAEDAYLLRTALWANIFRQARGLLRS